MSNDLNNNEGMNKSNELELDAGAFDYKRSTSCAADTIGDMPVDIEAPEYNMNHKKRGDALIFNHESFDSKSLNTRTGTNMDCLELSKALENLQFDVSVHKDLSLSEILNEIQKVALKDHTESDCILIAILSHGDYDNVYARDNSYQLNTLTQYFTADRCISLAGKPKLFFIQACRGDKVDHGITMRKRNLSESDSTGTFSCKIPNHSDFLIAYSSFDGYSSWRNPTEGSWFVQSLGKELNDKGKERDLLTLLTFVCRRVAYDFESNEPDAPTMQIPCFSSSLTRLLIFKDKQGSV